MSISFLIYSSGTALFFALAFFFRKLAAKNIPILLKEGFTLKQVIGTIFGTIGIILIVLK